MDKSISGRFQLDRFPSHVLYTTSIKNPKFVKINYQTIYNGRINRFTRANMINNLHSYIAGELGEGTPMGENLREEINIYTVLNHDSISRRKVGGEYKILWKPPAEGYTPRWDLENLASIWSKVINDTLITLKYLTDDSIQYISKISYSFYPVEDYNDRKIEINFYKND